jgi:hypothetical protein
VTGDASLDTRLTPYVYEGKVNSQFFTGLTYYP